MRLWKREPRTVLSKTWKIWSTDWGLKLCLERFWKFWARLVRSTQSIRTAECGWKTFRRFIGRLKKMKKMPIRWVYSGKKVLRWALSWFSSSPGTLSKEWKKKRASLGSSLPALRWMPAGKKSKIISAVWPLKNVLWILRPSSVTLKASV